MGPGHRHPKRLRLAAPKATITQLMSRQLTISTASLSVPLNAPSTLAFAKFCVRRLMPIPSAQPGGCRPCGMVAGGQAGQSAGHAPCTHGMAEGHARVGAW